jgi:hypothetical protein
MSVTVATDDGAPDHGPDGASPPATRPPFLCTQFELMAGNGGADGEDGQ